MIRIHPWLTYSSCNQFPCDSSLAAPVCPFVLSRTRTEARNISATVGHRSPSTNAYPASFLVFKAYTPTFLVFVLPDICAFLWFQSYIAGKAIWRKEDEYVSFWKCPTQTNPTSRPPYKARDQPASAGGQPGWRLWSASGWVDRRVDPFDSVIEVGMCDQPLQPCWQAVSSVITGGRVQLNVCLRDVAHLSVTHLSVTHLGGHAHLWCEADCQGGL